jgi:hypothetical protein
MVIRMTFVAASLLVTALVSSGQPAAHGANSLPAGAGDSVLEIVGQVGGDVRDVDSDGELAVVTAGPRLQVWDFHEPTQAQMLGQSAPQENMLDLVAADSGRAYAIELNFEEVDELTTCRGLRVFGTTPPGRVVTGGWVPCTTRVYDLDAAGAYAFVATNEGVLIVDAADVFRPSVIGTLPGAAQSRDVRVEGGIAFVVGHPSGEPDVSALLVYDVSVPERASLIGRLELAQRPTSVDVWGDRLYAATSACGTQVGLEVVDIGDPTAPRRITFVPLTCGGTDVVAGDGYAVVMGFDYDEMVPAVFIVDTSSADDAHIVTWVAVPWGLRLGRDIANHTLVASGADGLRVVDVTSLEDSTVLAHYPTLGEARQVAFDRGFAFVTDGKGELWSVDVSDPSSPLATGFAPTNVDAAALITHRQYVYVAQGDNTWSGRSGLHIVDASNADSPRAAGFIEISAETPTGEQLASPAPDQLALEGDTLYVPTGRYGAGPQQGFWTLDVSSPETPTIQRFQPRTHEIHGLAAHQGVLMAAAGFEGFVAFDPLSTEPGSSLSSLPVPGRAANVSLDDDEGLAALAAESGGLRLIDVSDASAAKEVGAIEGVTATSSVLISDLLYVPGAWDTVGDDGDIKPIPAIAVYDVSDPRRPEQLDRLTVPSSGGIAVEDQRLYLAAGKLGFFVLRFGPPDHSPKLYLPSALLRASP